jgi:hypothetical protein
MNPLFLLKSRVLFAYIHYSIKYCDIIYMRSEAIWHYNIQHFYFDARVHWENEPALVGENIEFLTIVEI